MIIQTGLDKVICIGALHIHSRTVAGPVTLINDAFTDADSTALASHTIAPTNTPATSWTARAGTWTIQSNKLQSGLNACAATCNSGKSDATLTAKLQRAASGVGNMALLMRYLDTSNYWLSNLHSDNTLNIYEFNTGSYIQRATASQTFSAGVEYALVFSASGNNLSARVGAGTPITYASSFNNTKTEHGVWQWFGAASGTFDDFVVTNP